MGDVYRGGGYKMPSPIECWDTMFDQIEPIKSYLAGKMDCNLHKHVELGHMTKPLKAFLIIFSGQKGIEDFLTIQKVIFCVKFGEFLTFDIWPSS